MRLNGMTVVVTLAVSVLSLVLAIVVFSHKLTPTEDSTLAPAEDVTYDDFLYDLLGILSSADTRWRLSIIGRWLSSST